MRQTASGVGELDTQINLKSTDEIGALAEAISRMRTASVCQLNAWEEEDSNIVKKQKHEAYSLRYALML